MATTQSRYESYRECMENHRRESSEEIPKILMICGVFWEKNGKVSRPDFVRS